MTLQIPKQRHTRVWNPNGSLRVSIDDTVNDTQKDERSPKSRTPKRPWRPPTSYSREIWSQGSSTVDFAADLIWWGGDGVYTGKYNGSDNASGYVFDALPNDLTDLIFKAEVDALTSLKGQRVNYGVALGERAQTARLIGNNLVKLREAVLAAKRLDVNHFFYALGLKTPRNQRKLEGSFDLWLEGMYGWKPLISDCYGAFNDLKQKEAQRDLVVTVKSHKRKQDLKVRDLTLSVSPHYLDFQCTDRIVQKVNVRLDYVEDESVKALATQLGLTNPAEIAWELLPWSFVADWFVPIGDFFSCLDAARGFAFKGGSLSLKTTVDTTYGNASHRSSYPPWPTYGSASVSGKCRKMHFERIVYTDSPTPEFPLFWKTGSSNIHVANGIALLMSAITGGTRVR